jgi:ATP diphosphatase
MDPARFGDAMQTPIERLLAIMARLRDPQGGCPWDLEQSFATIAPHTIEEAYEVDDAIRRGDMDGLREELGDLLLQVVFHAQMAREAGLFDFDAVAETLVDKLVRRHPHVFGDADVRDAEAQTRLWEALKAAERAEKAGADAKPSALDGVALGLPALLRAQKLVRRATRAGLAIDEPRLDVAWEQHRSSGSAESLGALLFALAQAAAVRGVDAEIALREATRRFETRVREREDAT